MIWTPDLWLPGNDRWVLCRRCGKPRFMRPDSRRFFKSKMGVGRCCCEEDQTCEFCENDIAPRSMQMVIGDAADQICTTCDEDLNGTYVVDYGPGIPLTEGCQWGPRAVGETSCGNFPPLTDDLIGYIKIYQNLGDYFVQVNFYSDAFGGSWGAIFKKNYGASRPDCINFVDEDIPLDSTNFTVLCDITSETCKLTAI